MLDLSREWMTAALRFKISVLYKRCEERIPDQLPLVPIIDAGLMEITSEGLPDSSLLPTVVEAEP